ncbi:MAG: sigma-70 family RNA polymerase sigma factor [Sphingomonas sp.]|nr:sigma-70 family RNA polymerase sigma factor [Sphingomonas sp.]MDX3883872.1 sigma-70 family RNA polymerase sigma factor [Sphingomonas sp.]
MQHPSDPDPILEHAPALRRYARLLTRDGTAAEDLVQETLLKAHERPPRPALGQSIRHWLFTVLRNLFIDGLRRRRSEAARIDALADARATTATPAQPADQEFATYLRQIGERFEALPEGQRAALRCVAIEGMSYQQAADALGVPVGTIMSRLNRARAALRADAPEPTAARLRIVGGRDDD